MFADCPAEAPECALRTTLEILTRRAYDLGLRGILAQEDIGNDQLRYAVKAIADGKRYSALDSPAVRGCESL